MNWRFLERIAEYLHVQSCLHDAQQPQHNISNIMKLGMSQACYRWTIYPQLRWDMPHYGFRGLPFPYGTTVSPPEDVHGWVDWAADKCASLGLSPLYATTDEMGDEDGAREFGKRLADRGLEFIGSGGGQFAGTPDEWKRDREKFIRQIRLSRAAGAKIVCAVNADPVSPHGQPWPNGGTYYGHFSKNCPIELQIDRMVDSFGDIVKVCEDLEMVLAFENHLDYRISEIVQVVERVDSPCLRINYDFGNSWGVVEDQVDAARLAAPYTAMTHLKDVRVQSITTTGEPAFFTAPLGYGHVEILEILEILQEGAPDSQNLPHCIEVGTLPQYDPDHWMGLSLDWLREQAGKYFEFRDA